MDVRAVVTVMAVGLGVALTAACSDESSSSSSSGGTSGSSSSSSSSSSGGSSTFKNCGSDSSQNTTKCTQAELDAYGQCPIDKCDAELQKCFGNGYKTGTFGGACATYISCTQKCECNDTTCTQKCGLPDEGCQTCLQEYGSCTQSKCPAPACLTQGTSSSSGGAGKTCADLETCCNGLTDATKKSTCLQTLNAIKASGDAACNAAYSSVCQ